MMPVTILLLWLLLFMPLSALAPITASPDAEHTVCPSGPPACDYATLQAAIAAAVAGDVVTVSPGEYAGPVALESRCPRGLCRRS